MRPNALSRARAMTASRTDYVPGSKPSLRLMSQPAIPNSTSWDVPKVIRAIEAHETGDFYRSSLLVQHFGRDDKITGATEDRLNALTGPGASAFAFQASDVAKELHQGDDPLIPEINSWWWDAVPDSWIRATLHDSIHLGYSLSYVEWATSARQWYPRRLHHWHPSAVRYDEHRQTWIARVETGRELEIHPGDPNWFLHTPRGARSWMSGAVRSLGTLFLARNWDFRDWARYNQRHGQPIITIEEPTGEGEAGAKDAFFQGIKAMGSSGVLRLPQGEAGNGYKVDLLEAKARSYDSFKLFMDTVNVAISIRLTGQNLTSEVQGGSYAAAGWHMRVRNDVVTGDASALVDSLRAQLLVPWGYYNVPRFEREMAPWPSWTLEMPEDAQALATTANQAVTGLKTLLELRDHEGNPLPIDVNAYLAKYNIPLLGKDQ